MQNDEIKEILYYWKKYHFEDCMIDGKECKLLYDYITNLQQIEQDHKQTNTTLMSELAKLEEENDVLKKKLDRRYYKNECKRLEQENERLKKNKLTPDELANLLNQELIKQRDDYKSRCEKAIEYIKEHSTSTYFSMLQADYDMNLDILLNILQNGG